MARGRMLDQGFARSQKLNSVTRDARLVYATILPFLDREGRHVAEPFVLKALVFRRSDFTIEEIAACLRELWAADLIRIYGDDDNDAILEYVDFARFNKPNAKEAKSAFPGPTDPAAGPCRDPLLLPAPAPHRQPTGDVPVEQHPTTSPTDAQHVQGTGNARATPVENVNENENENENGNVKPSSPELGRALAPPAVVEAAPRREGREPPRYQEFVDAWNANCGPLPRVQSLNSTRRGQIDRLRRELGAQALDTFTDAVKQVAREPYWREKGYGFGNLLAGGKVLNWAEKWRSSGGLSDSDRRLADKARAVAEAIGGL